MPRGIEIKGAPARWNTAWGIKAHIGEVQASIWDQETIAACADAGVVLL